MARKKLERIKEFDMAKTRLASIISIDPALDLGGVVSVSNFQKKIDGFSDLLKRYNATLSTVDDLYNQCNQSLLDLQDLSKRMLAGIASKYGTDSSQYEMAGGTRRSEIKKRTPRKKA